MVEAVYSPYPVRVSCDTRSRSSREGHRNPVTTPPTPLAPWCLSCSSESQRPENRSSSPPLLGGLETEGDANGNSPKGKCKGSRKSCSKAGLPPATLISFQESPPLSVPSENWNVTALSPKTVLLLRLIKTKTAIGLALPECNPALKPS